VKKVLPLLALVVALIILAPLAIAIVMVGVLAPAAVSVIDCGAHIPGGATGDCRPPFQQRYVLTSPFGRRFHPIYKEWRLHTGQDLSSLPSAGPVIAAAAGTVISGHRESVYGNIVSLRHGTGVVTRYGHLASIDPKSSRDLAWSLGSGSDRGLSGTSTGLHLHF
jgi:murein DD-endopeptidase MepM/ murein hydrolase activator NlpD